MELVPYSFELEGVTCFLSEKLSQDVLEKFFGRQQQKGNTNDNPTVLFKKHSSFPGHRFNTCQGHHRKLPWDKKEII